jgi:hypothetical protein
MNIASSERSRRSNLRAVWPLLQWFALFLAVVGVRLWMISIYSSSLPIRDQWDYEGATVFKPWLDGTFHVSDLFRPHNEHRMVLARLLGLGLLWVNGQWDSRLETVVNTVICGFFVVAAAAAIVRIFAPRSRTLIMVALALWLTLPYGHENASLALGTSYYFLVFFSLIAIWGLGLHRTLSPQWWAGAASLILACLDMAAGVFAPMALLALLALRLFKRGMKWKDAILPALLLLAVIGAAIYFRTVVPYHEQLKAASLGNWLDVFARCLAWPFCNAPLFCLLMYLPVVLVAAWYLRARADSTCARSYRQAEGIIVASIWVAMQAAAIAYTRGGSAILLPVSRYMEILAFGAVANLLAGVFLVSRLQIGRRLRVASGAAWVVWATVVASGAAVLSYQEQPRIGPGEEILLPYERSVRGYVATSDRRYLEEGTPPPTIPYPDPSRLAWLLNDPGIRSILPAAVRAPVPVPVAAGPPTPFVPNGYSPAWPNLPYEQTWGSYSDLREKAQGTLRSETITSRFPYLEFEVTGRLGGAMSLHLQDETTGRRSRFNPRKNAVENWYSGYVAMPGKKVHVVARDDNPAGWFVFREPREVGRFSVYADALANLGPLLCLVGGLLWLTSTAVSEGPGAWRFLTQRSFLPALHDESTATGLHHGLRLYSLLFVACLPIFAALYFQLKYWVNVPIWDEWDTPGIAILRAVQHELNWADLLAQHNESRKVIPRLLAILMAGPAGWDVRQGMVLTLVSACLVSAFVLYYLRKNVGRVLFGTIVTWAVVNLLLFAPSQYENFLSGFMWEVSFPILCLLTCITVNLGDRPLWMKVLCNSLLALLSTYTFAHGMLVWLFAFPLRSPVERFGPRSRAVELSWYAIYLMLGVASIAYYFVGYYRPPIAPPSATFRQIPQVLDFLIVWLGANFRSDAVDARVAGVLLWIVIMGAVPSAFLRTYRNPTVWKRYYPWLLLAGFSLGSGLMTAIGRARIGVDLAFNTGFDGFSGIRYNGSSVFACVALAGILHGLYADVIRLKGPWRERFILGAAFACFLLGISWIFMLAHEVRRLPFFKENRERAKLAATWASILPENPEIFSAYPQIEGFAQRVEEMKQFGVIKLPPIKETLKEAISAPPPKASYDAGFLDIGRLNEGNFRIAGWARNPQTNLPADYVILGWQESPDTFHPFTILPTGVNRPDLVDPFKTPAMSKAGFDREINVSKLPRTPLEIKGWAIDLRKGAAFPLGGILQLEARSE